MIKDTKLKTMTNDTVNTQEIEKSIQKNENDVCFTELDPSLGFKIIKFCEYNDYSKDNGYKLLYKLEFPITVSHYKLATDKIELITLKFLEKVI